MKRICQHCSKEIPESRNGNSIFCSKICMWRNKMKMLKLEIFENYGKECVCCGEDNISFLTIDHINNDGKEERKSLGARAKGGFYSWLKKNGYPKDRYQTMCFNCNLGKRVNKGVCPHQVF